MMQPAMSLAMIAERSVVSIQRDAKCKQFTKEAHKAYTGSNKLNCVGHHFGRTLPEAGKCLVWRDLLHSRHLLLFNV